MLVGYNTNIPYKDKTYHVQTEDNGKNNPVIVTLLYSQGAILASKKTSYADIISEPDYERKVRELMKAQHKVMIKELIAGKYTGDQKEQAKAEVKVEVQEESKEKAKVKVKVEEKIKGVLEPAAVTDGSEQKEKQEIPLENIQQHNAKAEAMDQLAKSLDDILLNYIMKRAK
jgi:hypothetical protein